jgi:hypothetical protein
MDGTGSGLCPLAGFGISGIEPSGSATRELDTTVFLSQPHVTNRFSFCPLMSRKMELCEHLPGAVE